MVPFISTLPSVSAFARGKTNSYMCMNVEIVISFTLWVSKQGTALTARNCPTGIADGFYEAMHCTNCCSYCDANSFAGLFSVAQQPPVHRMYSCESGFLNAVWDPLWSVLTFTCGLNGFEYANCVKQTYRVNTKKKKHTCTFPRRFPRLSSTLPVSLGLFLSLTRHSLRMSSCLMSVLSTSHVFCLTLIWQRMAAGDARPEAASYIA